MRDMADDAFDADAPPRKVTFLAVFGLLVASVVAAWIGFFGYGLWIPRSVTFGDRAGEPLAEWIYYAMSAGPALASGALIMGWLVFWIGRRPGLGIRLVFFIPVTWLCLLLAYSAIVATACGGDFLCQP